MHMYVLVSNDEFGATYIVESFEAENDEEAERYVEEEYVIADGAMTVYRAVCSWPED